MEEDKNKQESREINPVFEQIHEGLNVRTVREAFGLKQKELAAKVDTNPKYISNLELEKVIRDEELLNKIVEFFEIDIEWVRTNPILQGASIWNYNDNIINEKNEVGSTQTQANEINNNGVPFEQYDKLKDIEKELSVQLALKERDLQDAQKRIAELEGQR